jgi:hypothetical protein
MQLITGIIIGMFLSIFIFYCFNKIVVLRLKSRNRSIYQEILDNVISNNVTFESRINNNILFNTNIKSDGDVQIMYFIDKKDIAIFKNNNCLYTSVHIDNNILDKISKNIWNKFSNQINDTVFLSNTIFDRKTFLIICGLTQNINQNNEIIEINYNLDDILDKINKVGYNNLTDDEKNFLKNMNND